MLEFEKLNAKLAENSAEVNRNIDLLKQIAEKSKAAVGKWDTPLPGQRGGVRVDRKGTKLTKAVQARRAAKRKMFREAGMVKENGRWVKTVKGFK